MVIPIDQEIANLACEKMKSFYNDLINLYSANGIDLEANRGRRNMLMSGPMEIFLSEAIREVAVEKNNAYKSVISDGKTGEPDIVIENNDGTFTEIECKLTSPHQSSGSICFQTDHDTLAQKKSLDYVYIIANASFDEFCVVYFKGLTIDDFRGLSPGARGKVQMYKYRGMKKATVLLGYANSSVEIKKNKLADQLKLRVTEKTEQLSKWRNELTSLPVTAKSRKRDLDLQIVRGLEYIDNLVNKTAEDVRITQASKPRYFFGYEKPGDVNEIARNINQ